MISKPIFKELLVLAGLFLIFSASRAQEGESKKSLSLNLAFYQKNGGNPELRVSAKTKVDKKFRPVKDVPVSLFFGEETTSGFIQQVTTNEEGMADIQLPARFSGAWESASGASFIATVTGHPQFEDALAQADIKKAKIDIQLKEEGGTKKVMATLLTKEDSGWLPVPDAEIKLMVKGYFSDLPISEESYTTDSTGTVTGEFGLSLPGDPKGNISLVAKLDESDEFGSISYSRTAAWGTPTPPDHNFSRRTLWATRDKTPLWLLIFPNLIILSVWGVILYLIFLVFRIWKTGKAEA